MDYRNKSSQDAVPPIAEAFHNAYETLAPEYGYKTRDASAVPWKDVPQDNKRLMEATVRKLIADGNICIGQVRPATKKLAEALKPLSKTPRIGHGTREQRIRARRVLRETFWATGVDPDDKD